MGIVRKTTSPLITGSVSPFTTTNNITQNGSINNSGDQTGKVYGTLNQPEIFVMYTGEETATAKTTVNNETKKISVDLKNKGYKAGPGIAIEEHHDVGADIISADLKPGDNITIVKDAENVTISATDTTYNAGENIQINGTIISATDTTYTAGTNITIDANNKISAISYTAGYGLNLTDHKFSVDTTAIAEKSDVIEEAQTRREADQQLGEAIQEEADTRAQYDTALNNRIDSLESRGRFLSTWNATTGLPSTYPTIPETYTELTYIYTFRAGDYYIIHNVGTTNKKPTGSSITATRTTTADPWVWAVESAEETEAVSDNGTYTYDGTNWVLMGAGAAAAWGSIGGNIADQTDLNNTFVHKSGTETITGAKTFTTNVTIATADETTRKYDFEIIDNYYLAINNKTGSATDRLAYWNPTGTMFTAKTIPMTTNTYDLGESDHKWKDLYLQGKLNLTNAANTHTWVAQAYGDWGIALDRDATRVYTFEYGALFNSQNADLGQPGNKRWRDLYLSRNLKDGTNSISIADIVDKNTTQTITGNKTFTSINGSSSQTDKYLHVNNNNQLEWVTGTGGNYVTIDTNQTITGVKTFDNDVRLTQGKILTFEDSSYTALVRNETGILTINPNDASPTDKYCFNSAALYPSVTAAKDLGTSSTKWKDLYLSGNLTDGTNSVSIAAISTDKLPTVVNDKYLHTNATTGALEWSDASGGGGVTKYLHQVTIGAYPSSTVATMTFSLNIFNTSNTTITTHAQLCAAMTLNVEYPASGRIKSKGTYMYQVTKCKKIDDSVITVYYNRLNPADPSTYTELTYDSANLTMYGDNVA